MSLPNYLFIGAAKSATTTFFDILKKHEDIFVPKFKEPHFFNIDENYLKGLDWYKKTYFKDINNEPIIIDFTPTYLYYKLCAERIFDSLGPNVKFVIILRNPVDRAYSHYNHSKRDGHEVSSFEEAIKLENERIEKFRDKNDFLSELRCSYISQGLYFEMISAYLKYFDLNNFFIINFESEVVQNLDQTLLKLSKFLKLDLSNLDYEIHSNKSGKPKYKLLQNIITNNNLFRKILKMIVPQKQRQIIRNKIKNFNKEDFVYLQLSEEKRRQLFEKYYRKDIMKLENLIGKKMNWH